MGKYNLKIKKSIITLLLSSIIILTLISQSVTSEDSSLNSHVLTSTNPIILISPQVRQNPSILKIDFSNAKRSTKPIFTLYHHTGIKVFEKQINLSEQKDIVPGNYIFGDEINLASGYYFYDIQEEELQSNLFTPENLYFTDVSQTNLPGDSLSAAFTEFVDVTGDSFPDIILGMYNFSEPAQPKIYINNGNGHFINETDLRFPQTQFFVNDVITFDLDLDGDLDIYFSADDDSNTFANKDKLFLNDGMGYFTDISSTNLPHFQGISTNVDWGFINNDSFPDLIVSTLFQSIQTPLYILFNDGTGHFTDQSTFLPQTKYNAFDPVIMDVNNDSLNDIVIACLGDYIVTDPQGNTIDSLSGQNAVFIQDSNGIFNDETMMRMPDIHRWSKLIKTSDINNDNAPDLYSINIGFFPSPATNVLYVNNGYGYFQDETSSRLPPEIIIWNNDAEFTDFDQNGFIDMFMINVVLGGPAADYLYFNDNGYFTDESQHLPLIIDFNVSSALGDFENDSDMDIYISTASGTSEVGLPDLLYENLLPLVGITFEPHQKPEEFQLFQNYPNPFNPETILVFTLPINEKVQMVVYNILGEKVKILIDQQNMEAGHHSVIWDGTNDSNIRQASGVYFAVLKSGELVKTGKMILLR